MAKGNILKEAIADAKAVREVALVNAKAALEEAFTPKLQNMLSARLQEDLDEEYYEEDEELDLGERQTPRPKDKEHKDLDEMMLGDEEDSMDEEIDLEEILNELELEKDDSEEEDIELGERQTPRPKDTDHNVGRIHDDGMCRCADGTYSEQCCKPSPFPTLGEEEEEFNLDGLLEEINSLDKKIKPKRTQTRRNVQRKSTPRTPVARRIAEGSCRDSRVQVMNLKKELNESSQVLNSVRKELNEVNLLNSKLLYVNRIFKANDLDDPQKLRVVETLDKAGSVKEAKLIYETIKDSFSISNEALEKEIRKEIRNTVKKRKPTKPIRENLGMASKATGISRTKKVAPKRAVINESDNLVSRFQKLANIKINE